MTEERLVALIGDPGPLLLVEDDERDARATGEILGRGDDGSRFRYTRVDGLAAALAHLRSHEVSCVLLDLTLPEGTGLDVLALAQEAAPNAPIVVLADDADEITALAAVQLGAQDYLVKRRDDHLLTRAVRYAVERKRAELRLVFQAEHDPLTALPTRAVLLERLRTALAGSADPASVAVVLIGLGRFKPVNDVLGHDLGDRLLVDVGERLQTVSDPAATVARVGGDVFAVLMAGVAGERDVIAQAERMLAAVAEPFALGGAEARVTARAGIAFGRDGRDERETLRDADAAMAHVRGTDAPGRWAVFDETMRRDATHRFRLEAGLHRAVDRQELVLHYQPWVALESGRAAGVEALVRWDRPEHGIAAPHTFIGAAEQMGLIGAFGAWVLERACAQIAGWQRERPGGDPRLRLAVNLSARQLQRGAVVETVARALERSALAPGDLCLELTETVMIDEDRAALRTIADLQALGVRLALDDFGTGHASLALLRRVPFDVLKIDRSFVHALDSDASATPIMRTILELARALEVEVVAEGVETERQLGELRELGCRYAQGFHFARPGAAGEIEPLLRGTLPLPPPPEEV